MLCTEDGFWFSISETATGVAYEFHQFETDLESGRAASVDAVFDLFDAMVARRRGSMH